jgi:hypothetical protein
MKQNLFIIVLLALGGHQIKAAEQYGLDLLASQVAKVTITRFGRQCTIPPHFNDSLVSLDEKSDTSQSRLVTETRESVEEGPCKYACPHNCGRAFDLKVSATKHGKGCEQNPLNRRGVRLPRCGSILVPANRRKANFPLVDHVEEIMPGQLQKAPDYRTLPPLPQTASHEEIPDRYEHNRIVIFLNGWQTGEPFRARCFACGKYSDSVKAGMEHQDKCPGHSAFMRKKRPAGDDAYTGLTKRARRDGN